MFRLWGRRSHVATNPPPRYPMPPPATPPPNLVSRLGGAEPAIVPLRDALLRMVDETYETHHTPSSESGPEEWDYTTDAPSIEAVEQALRALADPTSADIETEPTVPVPPPDSIDMPIGLLRLEWPPNDGVAPGNPQFDALYEAIRADGYIRVPLRIRSDWQVIDGCHRLAVAKLLGMDRVPVVVWTGTEWLPSSPSKIKTFFTFSKEGES